MEARADSTTRRPRIRLNTLRRALKRFQITSAHCAPNCAGTKVPAEFREKVTAILHCRTAGVTTVTFLVHAQAALYAAENQYIAAIHARFVDAHLAILRASGTVRSQVHSPKVIFA